MEGQLRPALRADEEVVMVVVLELTVVLEDVEEDEVMVGADGACTGLADESTFRCIFSTLTAGVRIFSGWFILEGTKGDLRGTPGSFSLAGLTSLGLEDDDEEADKLELAVEGRPRMLPVATAATDTEPTPDPIPLPLLRFLADTGKGEVEAGLLAEICLLSKCA